MCKHKIRQAVFSLTFLLCTLAASASQYRILFIGNSYTSANNLPKIISDIAISAGDTIIYSCSMPGGCTFYQHVENPVTDSLIRMGNWDFVVLQEQSQYPSFPDGQFMNGSYPYAQQLCNLIRQYNSHTKIIFYMTWGRKNGDQYNCPYFPPLCTYEGMDSLLYERYMMMAEDNVSKVSPVGYVWHFLRNFNPEIELYQNDESHPSLAGSFVAACCFYTIMFEKNPVNVPYNFNLHDATARIIKESVKNLVYDSLFKWSFDYEDTLSVDSYVMNRNVSIYPNPVSDKLNIVIHRDLDNFNVSIYNLNGIALKKFSINRTGEESVDLTDLPSGVYLLRITDDKKVSYNNKFVKIEK